MSGKSVSTMLYSVALVLGAARAADTFTAFDFPGAASTTASGVNSDGSVVGWYVDAAGKTHGFLLSAGNFTAIDYPGSVYTDARGINSQGDIVGCHIEDATRIPGSIGCHGYLLQQGSFTPIDVPGKFGAIPQRINDAGQIVGCAHDDDGPGGVMMDDMHGFLYSNGGFTQLSTKVTMSNGLTMDGAAVAGLIGMNGTTLGYLAGNDNVVPFSFPFSLSTTPYDMTPDGREIAGFYTDTARKVHGFVLRLSDPIATFGVNPQMGMPGSFQFTSIDYPGAAATNLVGINARGDAVGFYTDSAGKRHGFFLSRGRRHQN